MARGKSRKAEVKMVQISLDQFMNRVKPDMHPYTYAFIKPQYTGIMKTEEEWFEELKIKKETE